MSSYENKIIQTLTEASQIFNDFINDKYSHESTQTNNDIKQYLYDLIEYMQIPIIKNICIKNNIIFDNYLFFLKLTNCNCCTRHFNNKPMTLSDYHSYPHTHSWNNTCKCNCRHLTRWICKICGDIDATGQSDNIESCFNKTTGINIY
jgi:hypothetical protein